MVHDQQAGYGGRGRCQLVPFVQFRAPGSPVSGIQHSDLHKSQLILMHESKKGFRFA